MIHIEQGSPVPEHPELKVFSPSGDYDDNAPIGCYNIADPSFAICAFSAEFVQYGGLVYRFSGPEQLGAELAKFDPASRHSSVKIFKQAEARRLKQERGDYSPDEGTVAEQPPLEIKKPDADAGLQPNQSDNTSTTTSTTTPQNTQPENSTPPLSDPNTTSTTTPITSTTTQSSTSTPPIDPALPTEDNSTATTQALGTIDIKDVPEISPVSGSMDSATSTDVISILTSPKRKGRTKKRV